MEILNEYSLLFVVAVPVAIIAGINLVLAMTGESGTLLLPSLRGYPAIEMPRIEMPRVEMPRVEATPDAVKPQTGDAAETPDEYRKAA